MLFSTPRMPPEVIVLSSTACFQWIGTIHSKSKCRHRTHVGMYIIVIPQSHLHHHLLYFLENLIFSVPTCRRSTLDRYYFSSVKSETTINTSKDHCWDIFLPFSSVTWSCLSVIVKGRWHNQVDWWVAATQHSSLAVVTWVLPIKKIISHCLKLINDLTDRKCARELLYQERTGLYW